MSLWCYNGVYTASFKSDMHPRPRDITGALCEGVSPAMVLEIIKKMFKIFEK